MINMPTSDPALSALALPQRDAEQERTQLGQEEFLALMVTQLQNQDPFKPMENGEFISQMAEFSNVTSLGEMSKSMEDLAASLYANQALQATAVVGRTVVAEGEYASLSAEEPLTGGVELPYPSAAGFVNILDSSGQLVKEISLGSRAAGLATFEWDGTLADGSTAEPGLYRIVGGIRNGADETALSTYAGAKVQSVSLAPDGQGAQISLENGQSVSFSQIKAIM